MFWRLFCECSPHYFCWLRDIARKTIWCWTKSKSYFFYAWLLTAVSRNSAHCRLFPCSLGGVFVSRFCSIWSRKVREHKGLFWGISWAVSEARNRAELLPKIAVQWSRITSAVCGCLGDFGVEICTVFATLRGLIRGLIEDRVGTVSECFGAVETSLISSSIDARTVQFFQCTVRVFGTANCWIWLLFGGWIWGRNTAETTRIRAGQFGQKLVGAENFSGSIRVPQAASAALGIRFLQLASRARLKSALNL